jgi:hypothetical protein
MAQQDSTIEREVRILLDFPEEHRIAALDLSSFVFDFNRLYVALLRRMDGSPLSEPDHGQPSFSRYSFRVPKPYELQISKVRFESPGLIEFVPAIATGVGLVWILIQIVEKAQMWSLQKKKMQLEIEKLERENSNLRRHPVEEMLTTLESPTVKSAIKQLEDNPIKPSDLTVKIGPADRS